MLTALQIKNAKPGYHSDGSGLYLQVSKSGSKSWIFRYQINGRRREMGLGSAVAVPVIDARAEAHRLLRDVKQQLDPLERRNAARKAEEVVHAAQIASKVTFEAVALEYIEAHSPSWRNAKHAQQWSNTLKTYVYPSLVRNRLVRSGRLMCWRCSSRSGFRRTRPRAGSGRGWS